MRILHTSDLHLGMQLHGVSLLDYQKQILDAIVQTALDSSADAVIIAGDIFDRAVPPKEAVALWSDFTAVLCGEHNIQAYVIAGNHDGGVRLSACSSLLERSGLHISGTIENGVVSIRQGNAVFHLMPYFTPDDVRAYHPDADITDWQDAWRLMLDEAENQIVPDEYNILIAHCFVSGAAVSESERAVVSGGLNSLDPSIFDKFDYTAAGHLHRRQKLGRVHYSGTPLCCSFSEADQRKTVTLIDTDTREVTEIEMPMPYILRTLRGSMEEITAIGRCDDYIRAEITSGYEGYMSLELLRELFPNLMNINVEQNRGDMGYTDDINPLQSSEALTPMQLLERFAADTGLEYDDELAGWFCESARKISDRSGEEKETII
nr:exonuclease SbcCD subunit D [Clostridia bacterium]